MTAFLFSNFEEINESLNGWKITKTINLDSTRQQTKNITNLGIKSFNSKTKFGP